MELDKEMVKLSEISREYSQLIGNIGSLVTNARDNVAQQINTTMLDAYWQIGQHIVEFEQRGEAKAEYGQGLLERLSRDLTQAYGKGFGRSNLIYMRKLYLAFPISGTLSHKLSWGHYYELLKIDDELERNFYIRECEQEKLNVRELKRQMKSMLFHRLALSRSREEVLELSREGQVVQEPRDLLKDPFVWEFVDVPVKRVMLEAIEALAKFRGCTVSAQRAEAFEVLREID